MVAGEQLIPHLFRTEYSKIVAVLCKQFGLQHIEVAQDIASETFATAISSWPYRGIPEHPTAWLYTVARNKVKNYLRREQLFTSKIAGELSADLKAENTPEPDLSESNIADSQLRMLFAVCHPSISSEMQVALALRVLCGFGIDEIATAFLTSKDNINKRLFRAKEKLRSENIALTLPSHAEIGSRLQSVITTLYLLFNEGYYSETNEAVIREDLCFEAMHLAHLLTTNKLTDLPEVHAILALMCFHASRLAARKDENGEMILYADQDTTLWNQELIAKGVEYFHRSSLANSVSRYHLEAAIAFMHTQHVDAVEKWAEILRLYNHLLMVAYSPVAALNRTYAFSKVHGKEKAIGEASKLNLINNHFYYLLLGELHQDLDNQQAAIYYKQALGLAKTTAEKLNITRKLESLAST